MNIGIANAAEVDQFWPAFASRLQIACDETGGDISSGDLWQMCRSGNAFLVLVLDDAGFKAALIMQFQKWTAKQVMRCMAIVGDDMASWLPAARDFIAQMAKDGGATSFIAEGREGWTRIFPAARRLRTTYEVELS
ncbi:hypothetical protein [Rhizobium laguerreae]|uniref:GNAT family N-acetyltransferase n=1 Tax=Rhizobium laguerreae TaxID=1076926 RepID=A0A7Y2RBZ9_9HYPH|nr:hypothetical protein [Rhizobium laguerreae]NNH67825.1 hypothetical protein [Rhizobium laguerreae]